VGFSFFSFSFYSSFFIQQFFLYISYVHNSSLWKKLCTQLDVYRKNYAHNLLLEKKNIHTSYSPSSCAHKLYAQVLLESNLCLKII
jgi:hypothetical protein